VNFLFLQDPELAAAFQDISANPANIIKYQNNPRVSAIITKLVTKFAGGMPGGLGGGFPGGFPPTGGTGSGNTGSSDNDVGLD
jgi:suppressor of tumorigenicity protein 13